MPPRMLQRPFPNGSRAKPKRGAKSFLSGKFAPLGAPLSPGNANPTGALVNRVDCTPGITEKLRPSVSSFGELNSYLRPYVSTSRRPTCHSSCPKKYVFLLRMLDGALGYWKKSPGM